MSIKNAQLDEELPMEFRARAPVSLTMTTATLQKFSVKSRQRSFNISLTSMQNVTATGAAVFSAQILRLLRNRPDIQITFDEPSTCIGADKVQSILYRVSGNRLTKDLITKGHESLEEFVEWFDSEGNTHIIFHVSCNESLRDVIPRKVRQILRNRISMSSASCGSMLLLHVLSELIKNTIDHSEGDAILGVEIDTNERKITRFSYCEGSLGFCRTLRKALSGISVHLHTHGSSSDLIHWATRPGNTTLRGSGRNLGLGLSVVSEAARSAGFSLSMLDAKSLIAFDQVAARMSHEDLRSKMINVGWVPCFSYLGERNVGF